jgi:hypothetical protein
MLKLINILVLCGVSSLASFAQEVYLVNAASVPEIFVSIDGQPFYPHFPQGLYTAGSATHTEKVSYKIQDPPGGANRTLTASFAPHSRQAAVIYGDFSPLTEPRSKRKTSTPNIKLFPLDFALAKNESRLRYRVVNLLPEKTLRLTVGSDPVEIPFEQSFAISGQKSLATLTVRIGETSIPVLIHQRRILRNCDVIFYPDANGEIRFIRFFEPNPDANDESDESIPEE